MFFYDVNEIVLPLLRSIKQMLGHRVNSQLNRAADADFAPQARLALFDGSHGNIQGFGHFLIGLSPHRQLQYRDVGPG